MSDAYNIFEQADKDAKILKRQNDETTKKYGKSIDKTTDQAKSDTKDVYKDVEGKKNTELYGESNANIAKTGGSKGRINDRSFKTTLKLAREADKYNSMPREEIMKIGTHKTGGVQNLGQGYEKPRLETQETRAMDQARELDTKAKSQMIDIQTAVARKDLDAFIKAYEQEYGIVLDKERAELEMYKMASANEFNTWFQQNALMFQKYFTREFGTETATILMGMMKDNPMTAKMLGYAVLDGVVPPEYSEVLAADFKNRARDMFKAQGYDKFEADLMADRLEMSAFNDKLTKEEHQLKRETSSIRNFGKNRAAFKDNKQALQNLGWGGQNVTN